MRLPADGRAATFLRLTATLLPALALGACGASSDGLDSLSTSAAPAYGPRGDYPVVVGDSYTIDAVTYTPEDVLNYDEVGFLAVDAGAAGITASHHTLPLPSYVEVTSLETGRTIVVRVERRGPMDGHELLALSPAALEQLAASMGTPVRVRRVNPPEEQRALLRAGLPATPRMDTPMSLVEILKRKLPSQVDLAPPLAAEAIATASSPAESVSVPEEPEPPAEARGAFVVQAAAFSTEERAERAAQALDGDVSRSGRYYRVRTGPFSTRGEAEASLAKVRAAGYSDARILTSG